LCTRISPVDVLLLPQQPCCKPDVRFRPRATAADGAMRQVKWPDMRRCNCGARMCVGCKLAGHSLTPAPQRSYPGPCRNFRIVTSNREEFQKDIMPVPFALCNGGHHDPAGGETGAPAVKGFPRRATEGTARRGKPVACAAAQLSQRTGFAARRSGYGQ
jgi:hypothetical protein